MLTMVVTDSGVLDRQPKFPREDLTDTNAELLAVVLMNRRVLNRGHHFAEREYSIFRATHPALDRASDNLFDAPDALMAVNFGIRALEAMTLLVDAEDVKADIDILKTNINSIVAVHNRGGVTEYFEQAQANFLHETPRTAGVISESASRYYDPRFAVLGGAVARQFEIDNIEDD